MRNKIFKRFSSGVDYLTIRANTESEMWRKMCEYKEIGDSILIGDLPFYAKFEKKMKEFEILRIRDELGQSVGQIKIVTNPTGQRTNIFDEIELQGSFFMAYDQYLQKVLNVFEIDIDKTRILSRIDYRFDILASSTNVKNYFVETGRELMQRGKKKISTWGKIKTDRLEVVYYDKKLDIREVEEKLGFVDVFGNKPYEKYLACKNDITRVEYRKNSRALRETERTMMEEMVWCKNDALEYMRSMGIYVGDDVETARTYKKQEDMRLKREDEIVHRAMSMIEAYSHRLDMHGQNDKLVRALYGRYGTELIRKLQDVHFELYRNAEEMFAESINMNVWK